MMHDSVQQQIGMASAGWKRTGTSARINGHTTHLYEQDGPMRFDDGATGLGADVAYIDVASMLVYRQVLLDLRHGRRTVVSGFDNDYRVVAGATASSAGVPLRHSRWFHGISAATSSAQVTARGMSGQRAAGGYSSPMRVVMVRADLALSAARLGRRNRRWVERE